jgi:hypothetical protein
MAVSTDLVTENLPAVETFGIGLVLILEVAVAGGTLVEFVTVLFVFFHGH